MELRSFLLGFSSTILIFILDLRSNDKEDESKEYFRGLYGLKEEYDLIIVGAGLSGSVIAQQASSRSGLTSLVIDKRDHIGGKLILTTISKNETSFFSGNCYDYIDEHGIRVSKYGAHIFHTKYPRVWEYVNRFSEWIPYEHKVKGRVKDINETFKTVPIPPNQVRFR